MTTSNLLLHLQHIIGSTFLESYTSRITMSMIRYVQCELSLGTNIIGITWRSLTLNLANSNLHVTTSLLYYNILFETLHSKLVWMRDSSPLGTSGASWQYLSLNTPKHITNLMHPMTINHFYFFGEHKRQWSPGWFFHQVKRKFHNWELKCQPLHLGLGTSPVSNGSLGSSPTSIDQSVKVT